MIVFDGTIQVAKEAKVEILVDFYAKASIEGTQLKFENFKLVQGTTVAVLEYVDSENKVKVGAVVGQLDSSLVTIESAKLDLARNDGLTARKAVIGSTDFTLFKGQFTSSETRDITISSIVLDETVGGIPNGFIRADIYVNGVKVRSATLDTNKMQFDGLNIKVSGAKPADIEIKLNLTSDAALIGETPTFKITHPNGVSAVDANGNKVEMTYSVTMPTITVVDQGSANTATASSNPKPQLLFAGLTAQKIGTFSIDAKNDEMKLTDLYVKANGGLDVANTLSNIKLVNKDGNVLANGIANDEFVKFERITANNVIPADDTMTFSIVADVARFTNSASVAVPNLTLVLDTAKNTNAIDCVGAAVAGPTAGTCNGIRLVSATNGATINNGGVQWSNVTLSSTHLLVRTALIASSATSTIDSYKIAEFNITPNSYNPRAKLTRVDMEITTNMEDYTAVEIYKGSISGTPLFTQTFAVPGTMEPVVLTFSEEIDSVTKFVVVLRGATSPSSSAAPSMQVRLVDFRYDDVFSNANVAVASVRNYENSGLPLSWRF